MLKRIVGLLAFALCFAFVVEAQATALSADRRTLSKNSANIKRYLMAASTTIYKGGMVMIDSDGLATPAAAEASNKGVVGVAVEQRTSAASGSYYIKVAEGWFKFAGTTLEQNDVGSTVYAEDDQTLDETVGTNEPIAGILIEYISASEGWVHIAPLYASRVAVTEPLTLTADLTLAEGATIGQATNNEVEITENSEDISFGFSANTITMSTDTGVVAWDWSGVATTQTFGNDQTIVTDTNEEIQFGDSEDVSMGFGTSNTLTWTSDTGVVAVDYGTVGTTLTLANDQQIVSDTDNEIQIGDNSEDISFGFSGSNVVDLSSDTGIVQVDFAAVGTTLTLANDQQIVSDTDNEIQFGDNSEDISLGFGTGNTVEITSDSGVTKIDFTTLNLETDGTLQILGSGATIGWTIANAANTACSTTCAGTGSCVVGTDGTNFVLCSDATADSCLCAGPAS